MKKLLLLLLTFYSFVFSYVVDISIAYTTLPPPSSVSLSSSVNSNFILLNPDSLIEDSSYPINYNGDYHCDDGWSRIWGAYYTEREYTPDSPLGVGYDYCVQHSDGITVHRYYFNYANVIPNTCPDGSPPNDDGSCSSPCNSDGSNPSPPPGWFDYGVTDSYDSCNALVDNVQFVDSANLSYICEHPPENHCWLKLADGVCAPDQHMQNGVCFADKCPGVNNFLLTDGSCSNCNYDDYLQDAQCNCQSINSSLRLQDTQHSLGVHISDYGINYLQYLVTCENGTSFQLLIKDNDFSNNDYNDTTPPDYNTTLPTVDYNSTSSNDYNSSGFLSDNNTSSTQNTNFIGGKLDNIGKIVSSIGGKLDNIGKIASSSNSKLSSIDSSLKAISSKNDLINSNLQSLKTTNQNGFDSLGGKIDGVGNKIDDLKGELSGDNFDGDLSLTQFTDFFNNVQSDLSNMQNIYDDTKSIIDGGFQTPTLPTGSDPTWTTDFHGKTITISLCSSFVYFKPILSFFVVVGFFILSIRIYIMGFRFL